MIHTKHDFINKIHLIISVLIVIPVSFIYGFYTEILIDVQTNTIDERNIFKAIMGLYLAFSIVWVLGIFKLKYLNLAQVTNMIFMLGLGLGRLLSLLWDGYPTLDFVFGAFGELFLGFYGAWILKTRYQSSANT